MRKRSLAVALVAAAMALGTSCDDEPAGGTDGGGTGSDADAGGTGGDSAADAAQATDAAPEAATTCDPAAWSVEAASSFTVHQEGEPPYDEACLPVFDRSCVTACDCKFVSVAAYLQAANRSVVWNKWVKKSFANGVCQVTSVPTHGGWAPVPGESTLACEAGACRALGKYATK